MSNIYIGARTETDDGPGEVVDVFQKKDELFAEVRLDSGPRIFMAIERTQFPAEAEEEETSL